MTLQRVVELNMDSTGTTWEQLPLPVDLPPFLAPVRFSHVFLA